MQSLKTLIIGAFAIISLQANAQWVEVDWEQADGITQMDFVDDNVGYAYMHMLQGFTSSFEKTTDGGQNWSEIDLPTPVGTEFQDMDFYDDGQGVIIVRNWESGVNVTEIHQTSDDGVNWENISPDDTETGYGIAQINFLNSNLGFFVTGETFYGTTDGGDNWITTPLPKAGMSIDFYDEMNGVIGTWDDSFLYAGGMLTTTDGGLNWMETELTEAQTVIGTVIQLDETTAYAASAGWGSSGQQQFYKTIDNGMNWTTIELPQTVNDAGLEALDFRDELNGVVAMSFNNTLSMFATTDGGENWTAQNEFESFYLSVMDLTPNSGYLTGGLGDIYRLSAPLSVVKYTEASFNVYPNPAKSNELLSWSSTELFSSATITDITGKVVFNTLINQTQSLQFPNLNSGIHFVSLENKNVKRVVKIVVD